MATRTHKEQKPESISQTAWNDLVESFSPEMSIKVSLRRLACYLTPQVTDPETLPPPTFRPDLDEMQHEIARLHGPGKYQLFIKWKTDAGDNKMLAPTFTLAPGPADMATEPMRDEGQDGSAAIAEAVDRLTNAARLKAQAAELSALGALTDPHGPAHPAPADPAAALRSQIELLKMIQPDPLTLLRTALEMVKSQTADPLAGVEKLRGLAELFGAAGGGGGAAKTTGWDLAIEALRQIGPNLPHLVALAGAVMQRMPAPAPAPAPATPMPAAPPTAALVPTAGDTVAAYVEGDSVKAERLRALLGLALYEMQAPQATDEDRINGYERVADVADAHLPGLTGQLVQVGPDQAWVMWMQLDPRVLNISPAGPWVRGFVEWLRTEAAGGGNVQ